MTDYRPLQGYAGQVSPDGRFVWSGEAWVPNPAYAPPKKRNPVWFALGVITLFVVFVVGGFLLLTSLAFHEAHNVIDAQDRVAEMAKHPVDVTPGQPFAIGGLQFAGGWSIGKNPSGFYRLDGFTAKNGGSNSIRFGLDLKFFHGARLLARVECSSDVVSPGSSTSPTCTGLAGPPRLYTRITATETY